MGVPSSSSRSSFTLTITNDGNSDHIRLVHDTSVGYCETVSKFSTFVDSSGGLTSADSHLERRSTTYLCIHVGRETSWHTESMDEGLDAFLRHRVFGVESGNTTLHKKGSEESRGTMTGLKISSALSGKR